MKCEIMSESVFHRVSHVKQGGGSELSGCRRDANQPCSTIKRAWICMRVRTFCEAFLLHVSAVCRRTSGERMGLLC